MCTTVVNVTSHLKVTQERDRDWGYGLLTDNRTWVATLPLATQNATLKIPTARSIDFFSSTFATSLSFSESQLKTALADIYIIYSNAFSFGGQNVSFQAVEVMFSWCSKGYTLEVANGATLRQERARSTKVSFNNASTLDFLKDPQYLRCTFGAALCDASDWGRLSIAPPPGFESHPDIEVEQLTGLGTSSSLQQSFWDGVSTPPWITSNQTNASISIGGMYLLGLSAYRTQGDITFPLAASLWPDVIFDVGEPFQQMQAIRNYSENLATGMENL